MKFMVLVKADDDTEAGKLPSEQLLAEMGAYNEELVRAGVMLAGEGLHPSSRGVRVRFSGGRTTVIHGPFPETRSLLAGFWLWDVESKDEALAWLERCPNPTGMKSSSEPNFREPDSRHAANVDAELELREVGCAVGLAGVSPESTIAAAPDTHRFLVLIKSDRDMEAGAHPGEERLAAMARRNDEGVQSGTLRLAEGLQPSSRGARMRFSGRKRTVVDGPFAETKELIAGFWLIQMASMDDAIEWVRHYPYPRPRDAEYEIEIRPVYSPEDFGAVLTPELREQEERLRARVTELNLAATRS